MINDTINSALKWRYATKAFDPNRKISDDNWQTIADSLVLTPSSFGLQPWKFLLVQNKSTLDALLPHSWNQRQVVDCSHFLVILHRKSVDESYVDSWMEELSQIQDRPMEQLEGYKNVITGFTDQMDSVQMNAWAQRQAYIALGQLMTTAALLNIDACPMEGIVPAEYDKVLNLEDSEFTTSVCCALGYRSSEDSYASVPKARFSAEKMIETLS